MISETNSLLEEINWKMHHKSTKEVNRRELILEWIDVFKYWLSIGLLWDITEDEFLEYFKEKSDFVVQRYLQEFSQTNPDQKVVICDIDGVLSDYPCTFLNFVKERYKEDTGHDLVLPATEVDNLNLYDYLRDTISPVDLKRYKKEYRQSGKIRDELVSPGSVEFLKELRKRNYRVVLLTSRPFSSYQNLQLDTFIWLTRNCLEFDDLICDTKKRDKIIKILENSEISFMIDDDPVIVEGVRGISGLKKVYLRDQSYNRKVEEDETVIRFHDFSEILEDLNKEC